MSIDPTLSLSAVVLGSIGCLVSAVGWLIVHTLKHIEATLAAISSRLQRVESEVAELQGWRDGYEQGKAQLMRDVR